MAQNATNTAGNATNTEIATNTGNATNTAGNATNTGSAINVAGNASNPTVFYMLLIHRRAMHLKEEIVGVLEAEGYALQVKDTQSTTGYLRI